MKHTTKEVTGCKDCPFCIQAEPYDEGYICALKGNSTANAEEYINTTKVKEKWVLVTPTWCPLKEETITIVLKNN